MFWRDGGWGREREREIVGVQLHLVVVFSTVIVVGLDVTQFENALTGTYILFVRQFTLQIVQFYCLVIFISIGYVVTTSGLFLIAIVIF